MTTDEIRKQVYDLRPSDLERVPIWEFALDEEGYPGQDEATVRPRPDLASADPTDGLFVVSAEFVTSDGTKFAGYVTPSEEDNLGLIQPTITTESGQVNFWLGAFPPEPGALQESYELLGMSAEQTFPLVFKAAVPTEGVDLEGRVPAFLHLASLDDQRIVEAT